MTNTKLYNMIFRPAVITANSDLKTVANRVAFGKFFNTGQVNKRKKKKKTATR